MSHAKCVRSAVVGILAGLLSIVRLAANPGPNAASEGAIRPLPPDICIAQGGSYSGCDGWWESYSAPAVPADLPPAVAPPVEPVFAEVAPRASDGKRRPAALFLAAPGATTQPPGGVLQQRMRSVWRGTQVPGSVRPLNAARGLGAPAGDRRRAAWNAAPVPTRQSGDAFRQEPSLLVCIGSYADLARQADCSAQHDWALAWNAAHDGLGADELVQNMPAASGGAGGDELASLLAAITRQSLQPRGFAGAELVEAEPGPWIAGLDEMPPAVAPPIDLEPLLPGLQERLFGQFLTPAIHQGGQLLAQWWSVEALAQDWLLHAGLQALETWGPAIGGQAPGAAAHSTQLWPHEAELFGL